MTVDRVEDFEEEGPTQRAVVKGIAQVAGVPVSYVALTIKVARRLAQGQSIFIAGGRRLVDYIRLQVDYTIAIPPSAAVVLTSVSNRLSASNKVTRISEAIQEQVSVVNGADYKITVTTATPVTITTLTTTPGVSSAAAHERQSGTITIGSLSISTMGVVIGSVGAAVLGVLGGLTRYLFTAKKKAEDEDNMDQGVFEGQFSC